MEALEFIERESKRTLDEVMKEYANSLDRVARLATTLIGGSAAASAWWLASGITAGRGQSLGIAALAIGWGVIAAALVWRAAVSNELDNGADVKEMALRFENEGGVMSAGCVGDAQARALDLIRVEELKRQKKATVDFVQAVDRRATAMDWAYRAGAITPACAIGLGWLAR